MVRPPAYQQFGPRRKRPRRWPWALGVAASLLILAGGGMAVWLTGHARAGQGHAGIAGDHLV